MKQTVLLLATLYSLSACHSTQQATDQVSTIDSTLQVNAISILESKLSEINAQSGQVIIMEVQSGQIKALVGLTKKDSADYQPCENVCVQQPTGLMHPVSLLAALETGKVKLEDKVDTGNGIYPVGNETMKDHNWHRGGYGEITLQRGIVCSSNIATTKTMEMAFGDNPQAYFDLLAKMDYGKPDSITGIANLQPYSITETDMICLVLGTISSFHPFKF